jgi:hypothetical protein
MVMGIQLMEATGSMAACVGRQVLIFDIERVTVVFRINRLVCEFSIYGSAWYVMCRAARYPDIQCFGFKHGS